MDNRLEDRPLLLPKDAAKYLAISVKQLRTLTELGKLAYLNVGVGEKRESRRYEVDDLEQYKREIKCRFTKEKVTPPTRSTSSASISDLQAIRDALTKEKQNGTKQH